MNKEDIQEASKILFEHRLNKTGLSSLKNLEPQTIDEAYAIQDNLKLRYLELKDNICIGKKIGATSLTAQEVLNMSEPFYGNLYSRYSLVNAKKLYAKNFFEPYAEPEISFRIKEDIDISKAPYTIDDIDLLLDGLVCSIEIMILDLLNHYLKLVQEMLYQQMEHLNFGYVMKKYIILMMSISMILKLL